MRLNNSYVTKALLILSSAVLFFACDDEYNVVGSDLIGGGDFNTRKVTYEVNVVNKNLSAVRTDRLPAYQLGDYNSGTFGTSKTSFAAQLNLAVQNPVFGNLSQELEDNAENEESASIIPENETVTKVYLNIPFFSESLVDTTDREDNEPAPFRVDSVFGNREAAFTLKVQEFTKFLRDLDPDSNFQEAQAYFSNEDPLPFASTVLAEQSLVISEEEILLFEGEDNPDTEDVDESTQPSERLSPRIRLELDGDFFQEKILDQEGQSVLFNANNFKEYLRGVYVSADVPTEDLTMLLNIQNAYIEIEYEYDVFDDNDTADDSSDDGISKANRKFRLNLTGNKVNYMEEGDYNQEVLDALTGAGQPSRLYLKGGSGTYAEIDISAGLEASDVFAEARTKNWLVNEANLIVYQDEAAGSEDEIDRLYLYDVDNERTLADYNFDFVGNTGTSATSYTIFDGIRDEEDENGIRYRFRITEYLNNIIRNDSTNVRLGLSLTTNIFLPALVDGITQEDEEVNTPQTSIMDHRGAVFYGPAAEPGQESRRLRLEVFYTEPN